MFLFCWREPVGLRQRQLGQHRNQDSPAPSKGRQAKSDTQPAADRMPEGIWPLLWLRRIKSGSVWLGKSGGPARRGLALFRFTFGRPKVNPSETKQRRGPLPAPSAPRGRGAESPKAKSRSSWLRKKRPAGAAGKNKQRLCLTKRQRRERPLRYHSSCPGDRGHSSL